MSTTSRMIQQIYTALVPLVIGSAVVAQVHAQSVPTDLVEISMEELFAANVLTPEQQAERGKRWHVSYRYGTSDFDQFYVGTNKRSYSDVLWTPGEERTRENYPVVPTEITQEVHALLIGYEFDESVTLRVALPFIRQSSDHISIVPGYDEFNITSSGFGDVVALADYTLAETVNSHWRIGAGVSIPTGSIDEEGDTPRAPGDQQLPYTMQMGSGTWDIPLGLTYEKFGEWFRWGADVRGTWRTSENDRGYRLGHKASTGAWFSLSHWERVSPGLRMDYRWQGKIHGQDDALSVPNPAFPYPAPVADPNAFGGEQLELTAFVDLALSKNWSTRIEYSQPVWLDLNGPQTAENYHFAVTIGTDF